MMTMNNHTLTAVPGFRVGHITDLEAVTGCTVILCPPGTVGGIDQRGGAPGTRETDLLRPMHLVEHVNAIVLAGGSAFGLAAADGVMRWCEAHGQGYATVGGVVPIVPAAILYDLAIGRADVRPDAAMGYAACEAASDAPVPQGSVGVGTGCRAGGLFGPDYATKSGLGSVCIDLDDGLKVAALFAVNPAGNVLDEQGTILGGVRNPEKPTEFVNALEALRTIVQLQKPSQTSGNTVIGVVVTNARLTREQAGKVAQMAHDGLARAVHPAHTMFDGDTIFALASGQVDADVNLIGAYAAEASAAAIRAGVRKATSLGGVNAWNEPLS